MELILLRPLWLIALLPWLWQGWRRRQQPPLLAPPMAAYLLPAPAHHRPWRWLACLPMILALSGPALRQQEQQATEPALDIWLLDLSNSMLARDLRPDRATRVRLLLQQMLAQAQGTPIALILFAGDAYLAMPATRDHQAIAQLLPDLRPAIMPLPGSAPARAVALALDQIPPGRTARLLLITDDLPAAQIERIAAQWPCQGRWFCYGQTAPRLDILLASGGGQAWVPPLSATQSGASDTPGHPLAAPDIRAITALASELGGSLQWLPQPLQALPAFAPLPMTPLSGISATAQWQDLGPWLLLPLLPLALLARVGSLWLLLLATGIGGLGPSPLQAQPNPAYQDRQALRHFQQGHYLAAARGFSDPVWQGNAWYRAGDYRQAVLAYARSSSVTAHYNRGNALVQLGDLAAAEQAYLAALALMPTHQDARYNLALLQAQPPQAMPQQQDPPPATSPEQGSSTEAPLPPAPPVLLLEQRLRQEARRRPLLKVEDPW